VVIVDGMKIFNNYPMKYNVRIMKFINGLLTTFVLLVLFIACGSDTTDSRRGRPATFVEPILLVKTTGWYPKVKLPLIVWDSFKYQMISDLKSARVDTKLNYCVVNEVDSKPFKLSTSIEFIEDATCFNTYFTSADKIPHKYRVGLVKVRILETGEEVWTWSKAVKISE